MYATDFKMKLNLFKKKKHLFIIFIKQPRSLIENKQTDVLNAC
jgi:hypothetical protein